MQVGGSVEHMKLRLDKKCRCEDEKTRCLDANTPIFGLLRTAICEPIIDRQQEWETRHL